MRKRSSMALEAQAQAQAQTHDPLAGLPVLSMEEASIMIGDAFDEYDAAKTSMAEVNHGAEVADTLENVVAVADNIGEASESEVRLVELVGDMAVAGTDIPPESIVPSLESYIGRRISTEGFKQTIKSIWEAIKNAIAKIWRHLKNFFDFITRATPVLVQRIKKFKRAIVEANEAYLPGTIKMAATQAFTYKGQPIDDLAQMPNRINTDSIYLEYLYDKRLPIIAKQAAQVRDITMHYDPKAGDEAALAATAKLAEAMVIPKDKTPAPRTLFAVSSERKPAAEGVEVLQGAELIGGGRVILSQFSATDGMSDADKVAQTMQHYHCYFEPSEERVESKEVTVDIPPKKVLIQILDALERLVRTAMTHETGSSSKHMEIDRVLEQLPTATEALASRVEKYENSAETENASKSHYALYKLLVNSNMYFTKARMTPASELTRQAITTIRTTLMVMGKIMPEQGQALELK